MVDEVAAFSSEVAEKLRAYVYRLIDPRNGETFYVGKGNDNRVFAHIREDVDGNDPSSKLQRIRDIHLAGFEVAHVIHRHGMDERTALEVEAALLDAYPGLTNVSGGVGSAAFGAMHAKEIVRRYAAEPAVFEHRGVAHQRESVGGRCLLVRSDSLRVEAEHQQGEEGRCDPVDTTRSNRRSVRGVRVARPHCVPPPPSYCPRIGRPPIGPNATTGD